MQVMKALRRSFDLDNHENAGFAFTVPLSHVAGLDTEELHNFESNIKITL